MHGYNDRLARLSPRLLVMFVPHAVDDLRGLWRFCVRGRSHLPGPSRR